MKKKKSKKSMLHLSFKKREWRKYAIEFLSVFIAVISAFALNNWNDNRRDRNAERNLLEEISNGLEKDISDIKLNMFGHSRGIRACVFWREIINNQDIIQDSVEVFYQGLTRDFISIQNTSGYESLKSRGLEIIQNDSLRFQIISLYEYDFNILRKFEEEYTEMQFLSNYFKEFNSLISHGLVFDSYGKIKEIILPLEINEDEKKIFLTYLRKIELNREFILKYYSGVEAKIERIIREIHNEVS